MRVDWANKAQVTSLPPLRGSKAAPELERWAF